MLKLLILIIATFSISGKLFAQTPGNVTGSTFWVRANNLITLSGANVQTWTSSGSIASSVTQGTAANRPLFRDGSGTAAPIATSNNIFNYSPYLFFDGTNDCLASTTSYNFGSSTTGVTQLGVFRANSGIVYFEWNGPNAMIKCKVDGNQCLTDGLGAVGVNNQYAVLNNTLPKIQHLSGRNTGLVNATGTGNAFCGYDHTLVTGLSSNNNPSGGSADRTNIGCNVNTSEFMSGGVAEIIIFNRILTETEILRTNSYLGIKYGITLGGAGSVTNYLSSSGSVIWNSESAYHNNVIGIGRDNTTSAQLQKQSHSSDDTMRIYRGTLAATNLLNASSFVNDISYVVMGNNSGRLCATNAANSEIPLASAGCTVNTRLEREWKVKRTNMAETFNIDVKLSACANLGLINIADLRLLVDDDGNFANGGTQCYSNSDGTGLSFAYTSPLVTVSGISSVHIPDNVSRYITIASVNPVTPLPVELLSFVAQKREDQQLVDLKWVTSSEKNSDYFDVEKLNSADNWERIARSDAAGNSQSILEYNAIDYNPVPGTNYYRLKQVDFDGKFTYSDIRVVNINADDELTMYPNPASKKVIMFLSRIAEKDVVICDETGRAIPVDITEIDENTVEFDVSDLANGVYFIKLSGNNVQNTKLLICH